MYGWIWNHLPGPVAVRVLEAFVLLFVVFPWVEPQLPFNDVTAG